MIKTFAVLCALTLSTASVALACPAGKGSTCDTKSKKCHCAKGKKPCGCENSPKAQDDSKKD